MFDSTSTEEIGKTDFYCSNQEDTSFETLVEFCLMIWIQDTITFTSFKTLRLFYSICINVLLTCKCAHAWCPYRPEEDICSLGTRLIGAVRCHVGAGN